ncbi:MAG: DUF2177 family protein [Candidatus Nanopelagicales bacterium]|nr:DUF2177 family protein [Candidatus Nanopelagicales bacterium]
MTPIFLLQLYASTLAVFLAVDLIWLGLVARGFYQSHLGPLLAPAVNWPAALVFYLLYVLGILIFAILPGLAKDSLAVAVGWGALFGFFTYATYDLTNLATLRDWPLRVVVVDILWGVVLCAVVASAGFFIGRWLRGGG